MKKIVIVGGGFGGINLAKKLAGSHMLEVVLVDRNNYNFFPPLLYQVSTAFIEMSSISYPFRKMFQGNANINFHLGSLVKVYQEQNKVEMDTGILDYDYLVLGMGTETNFFGNKNVMNQALPMKTIDDAINLRNHILINMERADRTADVIEKEKLRTIVIAGGGATGVEIASMGSSIIAKDYPRLDKQGGKIYLIDGAPVLLGPMSAKAQQEAYKVLHKLGVEIILNTLVNEYVDDVVTLSDGTKIPTKSLIWASGVIAWEAPGLPETAIGRGRRILVDAYNKVKDTENIFAIGDQCLQTTDEKYPNGYPQLAQIAIQQGTLLGRNIRNTDDGDWRLLSDFDLAKSTEFHKTLVAQVVCIGYSGWIYCCGGR
ncbi:FAD-dependent oxidoreductase [Sphingobacterium sp.]|uniref:NAD(P)/FAD-dependent oxidoreductase n=1 Tax=Sphingobacterium sp. TaxID=341027 RepID=UPI0031CEBB75